MSFRVATSCALLAVLAGCTTSTKPFRPTMGSDQASLGIEAVALLNELQRAYTRDESACLGDFTAMPSLQNVQSESFRRLRAPGQSDRQAAQALRCITFKTDAGPGDFVRHLNAGEALADLYCDDYFRRIALHKQMRQFGRSTTNDIGTAASAALGLATAGSVATGGAGVLFGLLDGMYRNYDAAFVVEPDLGKVLKLVQTAQVAKREYFVANPPQSYPDANAAITSYAQLCSYAGMQNLLNVAIEAGSNRATITNAVTPNESLTTEDTEPNPTEAEADDQ